MLLFWGGDIVTADQFGQMTPRQRMHAIQVAESLYQVPHREPETGDFIHYSCDPNAGLDGPVSLVALRDIRPGEEVCCSRRKTAGSLA